MTFKNIVFYCVASIISFQVSAQQSEVFTNDMADYQKALTLYNNQQYLASQSLFESIGKTTKEDVLESDCAYYIANCAIRLNQQNADKLIENFVNVCIKKLIHFFSRKPYNLKASISNGITSTIIIDKVGL